MYCVLPMPKVRASVCKSHLSSSFLLRPLQECGPEGIYLKLPCQCSSPEALCVYPGDEVFPKSSDNMLSAETLNWILQLLVLPIVALKELLLLQLVAKDKICTSVETEFYYDALS